MPLKMYIRSTLVLKWKGQKIIYSYLPVEMTRNTGSEYLQSSGIVELHKNWAIEKVIFK